MKKKLFRLLVKINHAILPRYSGKDPSGLTKAQQAVLAYRYWVLIHSL